MRILGTGSTCGRWAHRIRFYQKLFVKSEGKSRADNAVSSFLIIETINSQSLLDWHKPLIQLSIIVLIVVEFAVRKSPTELLIPINVYD